MPQRSNEKLRQERMRGESDRAYVFVLYTHKKKGNNITLVTNYYYLFPSLP